VVDVTHGEARAEKGSAVSPSIGRRARWKLIVSAVLMIWLGAQFVAGWKFANSQTYPIVGSAMFNGPPIPGSPDFLVPRVFGVTSSGSQIEIDQNTFGLEPFEWRRWIKRNLEDVSQQRAEEAGADLAAAYTARTGQELTRLELWRIPALTDDFERARFGRAVDL
jgi:hypothetical protein